jgi:hypothetical protein
MVVQVKGKKKLRRKEKGRLRKAAQAAKQGALEMLVGRPWGKIEDGERLLL